MEAHAGPGWAGDLRLFALGANARALSWYWRLGFVTANLWVDYPDCAGDRKALVYVMMRRAVGAAPVSRFFGEEMVGRRLRMLPAGPARVDVALTSETPTELVTG